MVETSDTGYVIVGSTGTVDTTDIWLVKTDTNGNIELNQTYGEPEKSEGAHSVVETSDVGLVMLAPQILIVRVLTIFG